MILLKAPTIASNLKTLPNTAYSERTLDREVDSFRQAAIEVRRQIRQSIRDTVTKLGDSNRQQDKPKKQTDNPDKKDLGRGSGKRKFEDCFGLSTAQPQRKNKLRANPPEEDELNLHSRV